MEHRINAAVHCPRAGTGNGFYAKAMATLGKLLGQEVSGITSLKELDGKIVEGWQLTIRDLPKVQVLTVSRNGESFTLAIALNAVGASWTAAETDITTAAHFRPLVDWLLLRCERHPDLWWTGTGDDRAFTQFCETGEPPKRSSQSAAA